MVSESADATARLGPAGIPARCANLAAHRAWRTVSFMPEMPSPFR